MRIIFFLFSAAVVFTACSSTKKNFCAPEYAIDFSKALQFAELAELAYAEPAEIDKNCGADSCFHFQGHATSARAYLRINDSAQTQWLAFRGTASFSDVKLDAEYTQNQDSILRLHLHKGFSSAARDLYPDIRRHLRKDYKIKIAGHSLGGAIAAITGLYLQQEGFSVEVYTFGQPKITNIAGAARADSLHLIRFLNGRDMVTLVPPVSYQPGKLGSYAHFGKEIALLDGKNYECLQEHFQKRYNPDSWWDHVQEQAMKDHGIANYLEKLRALVPTGQAMSELP